MLSRDAGTSPKPWIWVKGEELKLLTLIEESGLLSGLVAKAELRELLNELYDDSED